ncbi:MAG: tol-pal system protein YbgF [Gammaproteobacteria bacterium]|nr:tol-pal system protein YbgF [Gammaproteobacteria bacterium]
MKIKLLYAVLGFVIAIPALAAPIVEGQPEMGGYPLAQNNTAQSAPMMQVQTSNTDPSDMVNTVTQLQQQVRDLEGRLEVQAHQIDQLTQAQKNIYLQLGNRSAADTAIDAAAANLTTVTVNTATSKPSKADGVSVKPVASTTTVAAAATNSTNASNTPATSTAAAANTKTTNDDQQKALYDRAYQAITQQQYSDASVEMNSYLTQYPNGYYAANAHYWLGEIGLVGGDLNSAQTHFQAVVTQFPNTPKVSDAQLKLGYIYYQQGKWALARQTLQSLVQQYPNTSAATLATQRLQDMTKQGV